MDCGSSGFAIHLASLINASLRAFAPLPGSPRDRPLAGQAALGLGGDMGRFLQEDQGAEVSGTWDLAVVLSPHLSEPHFTCLENKECELNL